MIGVKAELHGDTRIQIINTLGIPAVDSEYRINGYKQLFKSSTYERSIYVASIGNMGANAKSALTFLNDLKTDKEQAVREAAIVAIKKIDAAK